MKTQPVYDRIGKNYNATRTADAYITNRLHNLLAPLPGGRYFDIGCGTGNYTHALKRMGVNMTGIEPSGTMLAAALALHQDVRFIQAQAEDLPVEDAVFDGGIGTFTIHHWSDIQKGLNEIYRILKPGARFVLFSFTPAQLLGYWLCHSFPVTMKNSAGVVLEQDEMEDVFRSCGFESIATEKYFVHEGLTDHFLYSNKYHPEQYLDPKVRNNASSFTVYADEKEVRTGLMQLEQDIATGEINNIIKQYENSHGDYLFYIAGKPASY